MICHRCLQRAARHTASSSRAFSHTSRTRSTPVSASVTTQTNPRPNAHPAATTTPSVAQPLSTPGTPSISASDLPRAPPKPSTSATANAIASSVPAGMALKGINFLKNASDPIALADDEYPAWLWGVLQEQKGGKEGKAEKEGDLFAKSKKQRQIAARALRRQEALNPGGRAPQIPVHEQTVDLPGADAEPRVALKAREDLTKSMRGQRRKKIKEVNFLKAMG